MNSGPTHAPRHKPHWKSLPVTFIEMALRRVTFNRLIVGVFVLPLLIYVYREVTRDVLIIDPIAVPRRFEEAGLSSEVMANRIGDALRHLEIEAHSRLRMDTPI